MGDSARRPGWEARLRLPLGRRGQGDQGGFSAEGSSEVSLESRVLRQDGRAVVNRDLQGRLSSLDRPGHGLMAALSQETLCLI